VLSLPLASRQAESGEEQSIEPLTLHIRGCTRRGAREISRVKYTTPKVCYTSIGRRCFEIAENKERAKYRKEENELRRIASMTKFNDLMNMTHDFKQSLENNYPTHLNSDVDELVCRMVVNCSALEVELKLIALQFGFRKGTT
jgi:hypothetical protein